MTTVTLACCLRLFRVSIRSTFPKGDILIDLSSLAEPISESSPCGTDQEYDADFLALSQAIVGRPEQQFGRTVIPAVEPDWRAVERMATELLGRTKDLRVVAWLTLAATHVHGVLGFGLGIGLLLRLCERYWDDVHPRMVIDGEEDPYLRINAISAISETTGGYSEGSGIMRALRSAVLVNQALQVTVRDVEMSASKDPSARYSDVQVASAISDAIKANAEPVEAFEQASLSVTALDTLLGDRFLHDEQPDLSALKALIKMVAGAIDHAKSTPHRSLSSGDDHEGSTTKKDSGSSTQVLEGIRSREDVRQVLQRVCDYLERYEPSNPAALFARRAKGMLDRSFMDIIAELSPDSVHHLQMITGAKLPEE
jgi:type VI secretion system protein ImpA